MATDRAYLASYVCLPYPYAMFLTEITQDGTLDMTSEK